MEDEAMAHDGEPSGQGPVQRVRAGPTRGPTWLLVLFGFMVASGALRSLFDVFGIALALVTWFSGAAICLLIGACAGPVLAEDEGAIGSWIRGGNPDLLVPGAAPALAPPVGERRLSDAFTPVEDGALDS